jgi:hypothetical protein
MQEFFTAVGGYVDDVGAGAGLHSVDLLASMPPAAALAVVEVEEGQVSDGVG